jgi:hypothetical protein
MSRSNSGTSVFSQTTVQAVTAGMLSGGSFDAAKAYVVSVIYSHPTVSRANRIKIVKNVKSTDSYLDLLSLLNNTINSFNRVKAKNSGFPQLEFIRASNALSEGITIRVSKLGKYFTLPNTGPVTLSLLDQNRQLQSVVFKYSRDNSTLYAARKNWPSTLSIPHVGNPVTIQVASVK